MLQSNAREDNLNNDANAEIGTILQDLLAVAVNKGEKLA